MVIRKIWAYLMLVALIANIGCATANVAVTNRMKPPSIPISKQIKITDKSFMLLLKESRLSNSYSNAKKLKRVGTRIAKIAEKYLKEQGRGSEIKNWKWDFTLINRPRKVDAFCFPGGKVVVYTGVLAETKNSDGLAAIVGYVVAHAILNHPSERMIKLLKKNLDGMKIDEAIAEKPVETYALFLKACGMGAKGGKTSPYTMDQLQSADQLGLVLMAKAGYYPEAGLRVWKHMKEKDNKKVMKFLEIHPMNPKRIKGLEKAVIEAQKYNKLDKK